MRTTAAFVAILGLALTMGCEREEQADPQPTTTPAAQAPAEAPPAAPTVGRNAPEETDGQVFTHQGVAFVVPEGWQKAEVDPSRPMAPVAIFNLPAEGEGSPAEVRITYFPNMKGMDDMNINRWVQQVNKNGAPAQLSDAQVTEETQGMVRLKVVDLEGNVQSSMGDPATAQNNQRLIAAIVDHPQGPHFVRVTGDADVVNAWADSVFEFLRSATVR